MKAAVLTKEAERRNRRLFWLLGVLLVLGCGVIYRHVGAFGFVAFDDDYNLLFNPHLGPLSLDRVQWAFGDWQYARRCMPLGWLGFFAIFSLSGLNPAGYHLAGLGLHATNALLLFVLLDGLAVISLPRAAAMERNWCTGCAFLGAIFWAWHPLRVETVAWSSGLLYGQADFFLLLALVMLVRLPAAPAARLGAVLCYGWSLLTYPVAIGAAPVFVVIAAWRLRSWRRGWAMTWPFVLLAAVATVVNLKARVTADSVFTAVPTLAEFPLAARAMRAAFAWIYYAWVPFWPVGLTPVNPVFINFNPWSAAFILSAVVLVMLTVASIAWPVGRRTLGPFWLLHVCVLVPLIGLVEHDYFPSDRYAAFPQAILAVALVLVLVRLRSPRVRTAAVLVGLAAGGVIGLLSTRQVEIWRDTPALFRRISVGLTPEISPTMYFQRPATIMFRDGDAAGALALLDRGIALLPENSALRAQKSDLLGEQANLRAMFVSDGIPLSTPAAVILQQELGVAALRRGDLAAAQEHLRLAAAGAPDFYAPAYNRALAYLRQGETQAALGCYLWAEAHGGEHLPSRSRLAALGLIADQFAAAGKTRLAAAVRSHALRVRRD